MLFVTCMALAWIFDFAYMEMLAQEEVCSFDRLPDMSDWVTRLGGMVWPGPTMASEWHDIFPWFGIELPGQAV